MRIYVAGVETLWKKERQDETLSLSLNLLEKIVWVIVISLCKIFIPSYRFGLIMPKLAVLISRLSR